MAAEIDEELDALFGGPLNQFTAERDELARRLGADGRREQAEEVRRLRKPTVSAWLVNQLARRRRKDVDLLLDAGHRIREAQRGVLTGSERKAFDEARERQQRALDSLQDAAAKIVEQEGVGATAVERAMQTLRAAVVTDEGRELLARGRLAKDLEAPGFEAVAQLGIEPSRRSPRRGRESPSKADRVAEARGALNEAKRHEREARRAVERAERELDALRARADEAARAVDAGERKLRNARKR